MKPSFALILTTLSATAFAADVDYSKCSSGIMMNRLNNDGQIEIAPNQKLLSKSSKGNTEKYVIESDFGAYSWGATKFKHEITLQRDDQGRVVKVVTGPEKLDKRGIEEMKKISLQMQVGNAVTGANMMNANYMTGFEPMYKVDDEDGNSVVKKLSELNRSERAKVGVSEELYEEISKKVKKDKKSMAKIEKGLKELQSKTPGSYAIGTESDFEFADGVCRLKSSGNRYHDGKSGQVFVQPSFNREACEEVSKLFQKHKDSVQKCEQTSAQVNMDIAQNYDKLKDIMGSASFSSSIVMGMGFGGMGMFGGQQSQISMLKNYCDYMLGEMNFEHNLPREKDSSPKAKSSEQ